MGGSTRVYKPNVVLLSFRAAIAVKLVQKPFNVTLQLDFVGTCFFVAITFLAKGLESPSNFLIGKLGFLIFSVFGAQHRVPTESSQVLKCLSFDFVVFRT